MENLAQKHNTAIEAISLVVINDEKGVKALLKRNGVDADFVQSKNKLSELLLDALAKSKGMVLDFDKYVKSLASKGYSNASGMFGSVADMDWSLDTSLTDGASNSSWEDNITVATPPIVAETPKSGGGFFNSLERLINTGLKFGELKRDIEVSKNNRDTIKDAVKFQNTKEETQTDGENPEKSNVMTYVGFGILGVALIGGIIYFATKK